MTKIAIFSDIEPAEIKKSHPTGWLLPYEKLIALIYYHLLLQSQRQLLHRLYLRSDFLLPVPELRSAVVPDWLCTFPRWQPAMQY